MCVNDSICAPNNLDIDLTQNKVNSISYDYEKNTLKVWK